MGQTTTESVEQQNKNKNKNCMEQQRKIKIKAPKKTFEKCSTETL
jgi:hypothetical protein